MKDVVLSTGQTATIRSKDELTEGQSREIEIARARGSAVFQRFQRPVYLVADPDSTEESPKPDLETFERTDKKALVDGVQKQAIPSFDMDKLSDEEFVSMRGFEDASVRVMAVSIDGEPIGAPTSLVGIFDELSALVLAEYSGLAVETEGPDEKIDPLVEAAESTDSSTATLT